jgi:hypothetical protein
MLNAEIAEELDRPYEECRAEGRKEERGAITTWLRSLFPQEDDRGFHRLLSHLASAIEAEEHRE